MQHVHAGPGEPVTAAFRLLGPLEVVVDGCRLAVPAGRQRALLAALLLRADRAVPLADLGAAIWGGSVPANPRSALQKYVMRLRRVLAGSGAVIRTESDGYRIDVPPGQLDLALFADLVDDGRRAARRGDLDTSSRRLGAALGLWRAVPPLTDVVSEVLHRDEVPALVERYLQAVETRIGVDLRAGRHAELIGELLGLVRRHPLREPFWAQRMRALHAAGRQGEALAVYREVRTLLADELGADPGTEVTAAYRVLLGEPGPAAPVTRPARQLPAGTSVVVGREAEIDEILAVLDPPAEPAGTPVVAVTGPAGVGKTAVVVHAAHWLAARYPEGQLFAELGTDGAGSGVDNVLGRFLGALGVPRPAGRAEAVAAWRSHTAGRRLLVVLDAVPSSEVARALLPGSPTCGVLITSRDGLRGPAGSCSAHRMPLRPLGTDDAACLLRRVAGARRVAGEPAATDRLLARCAGSPLALRTAADRLATSPRLLIGDYLAELDDRWAKRVSNSPPASPPAPEPPRAVRRPPFPALVGRAGIAARR